MRISSVLFMIVILAVLFYLTVSRINQNKVDGECQKKVDLVVYAFVFGTLVTVFFQPLWIILNNI